jgi:multidrug efflux pump subunit AcrA (membrane-fusion protein)
MRTTNTLQDYLRRVGGALLRLGLPLLILLAGLIGFLVLSHIKGAPAHETRAVTAPLVETVCVSACDSVLDIKVDGIVVPYREIEVAAEVPGRVKYKSAQCRAGHYVTQGTPLIEIDPADFQLEVRRLTMELEQAKVLLEELDVEIAETDELVQLAVEDVEIQSRELARVRGLTSEQVVTETRGDQAARAELAARNALTKVRSQFRLLQTRRSRLVHARELASTQLAKAQLDLQRTKVVAPADGVIVRELVEEHSYVQKGMPLFALEDTSSAEVKCNLRADDINWLCQHTLNAGPHPVRDSAFDYQVPPTPATIVYKVGGREFAWDGVLARYDGIGLDEQTRTFPCRVEVPQPRASHVHNSAGAADEKCVLPVLVRGMYVTVYLHARPNFALGKLPPTAVRPGNVVWLVENGILRRRKVDVLQRIGDGLIVPASQAAVEVGSRVVVSPLVTAYDGMRVRERRAS